MLAVAVLAGYGFGIYTLPSLDDALTRLAPVLGDWTYPLVSVLAYLEAAAFVGLLVPGELTVVLGGAVARDGEISIELLFVLVWLAAVAGDTTGFLLGRKLGRGFLLHHGPRFHITPQWSRGSRGSSTGTAARRSSWAASSGLHGRSRRSSQAARICRCGASWPSTSRAPEPGPPRFLGVGYLLAASASGAASLSHTIGLAIGAAAVVGVVALGIRQVSRSAPRGERLRFALRQVRAALIPGSDAERP